MPEATLEPALDPRIRRTRDQLQCALARLLQTHDFDRISVHEITAAAQVNRATFYAHYTDKFALLECMVAGRFHTLLDQRGIVIQGGCTEALRGLVIGLCDFLLGATCPTTSLSSRPDPEQAKRVEGGVERPAAPARTLQPHMETAIVSVLRRMVLEGLTTQDAALNRTKEAALKGTGFSPSMNTEVEKGALAPEAIRSAAIAWAIYGATREALNTPNYHSTESIAATVITLIAPLLTPPQSPSS